MLSEVYQDYRGLQDDYDRIRYKCDELSDDNRRLRRERDYLRMREQDRGHEQDRKRARGETSYPDPRFVQPIAFSPYPGHVSAPYPATQESVPDRLSSLLAALKRVKNKSRQLHSKHFFIIPDIR